MLYTLRRIFCTTALCAAMFGNSAMAFDFQNARTSADKPIRLDTSSSPADAFAKLAPSAGKEPEAGQPARASLIMDIPNASYWTPYVGVGAGAGLHNDPLDYTSSKADYNFMAGTMLQTDPDKKGRQHQLTVGYRYNESTNLNGTSAASSLTREPSHNLEMDWRFKF